MLSYTSPELNKKKSPRFRPVPGQMQRVTPLLSSPSCHQITTHLSKIQARRKADRGGEGVRRGCSLTSSLGSGICDALLLLCKSNVKLSAAREGEKKKRVPCKRRVAVTEKIDTRSKRSA